MTKTVDVDADTVLIVDDDQLIRETYDLVLRHGGWNTLLADSSEAALEHLQHTDGASVMVTDLTMSGLLDGEDLVELVKSAYPAVGIVVTTGRQIAPDAFGDDVCVLLKPFRVEQLLDAARSAQRSMTS
jgi:two-component system, response regulator PdtaR